MQEEARQGKHIPEVDNNDAEIELFPYFLTAPGVTQTNADEKDSLASLYIQPSSKQERPELEDETGYEEHPGERLQTLFSGLKGHGIEPDTDEQIESVALNAAENNINLASQVDDADFDINVADLMNFAHFEDELNFEIDLNDRKDKEQFSEKEHEPGFDEDFNDLEIARQLEELENRLGFEVDLSNLEVTKQPNIFEDDLNFADSLLDDLENTGEMESVSISGTQLEVLDNPFDVDEQTTEAATNPFEPFSFDEQGAEAALFAPFSFDEQSAEAFADPFSPSSMEATEDGVNTLLLNNLSAPAFMSEAQTVQLAQTAISNNATDMAQFAGINNHQFNHPPVTHTPQGFAKVHKRSSARLVSLIAVIVAIVVVASLVFVLNKGNAAVHNKGNNIAGQTISIDVGKPTSLLTPTNAATTQPGRPEATATSQATLTSSKGTTTASGGPGNTQNTGTSQPPSSGTTTSPSNTTGSSTSSGSGNTTGTTGTTAPPAGSSSPPTTGPSAPPPPAPVFTSFTGGSNGSYDTNVNLTSTGNVDWAHWGGGSETSMSGGANVISGVSWNSAIANDTNQSNDFTWSNGTSPGSVSAYTSGTAIKGGSASFAVKTSPVQHTLRVYVGAYLAQGTLTITLNGKTAYSGSWDMSHDSSNAGDNTMFIFSYKTNVDSHFTVTYAMTNTDGSSSYIMLEAAAVS